MLPPFKKKPPMLDPNSQIYVKNGKKIISVISSGPNHIILINYDPHSDQYQLVHVLKARVRTIPRL